MFRGNVLCFSLCSLSLVSSLGTTAVCTPSLQLFVHIDKFSHEPSLPQAQKSQCSLHFLTGEMVQSLNHPEGPLLDSLQ